jgi:hypothetical protein
VTSSPAGISCPPDCSERPVAGEIEVTAVAGGVYVLTARPAAGSVFTRWAGGCMGTSLTCTVVLTQDTFVAAWFDLAGTPPPSPSPSPSPSPTPTPPPPPLPLPDAPTHAGHLRPARLQGGQGTDRERPRGDQLREGL